MERASVQTVSVEVRHPRPLGVAEVVEVGVGVASRHVADGEAQPAHELVDVVQAQRAPGVAFPRLHDDLGAGEGRLEDAVGVEAPELALVVDRPHVAEVLAGDLGVVLPAVAALDHPHDGGAIGAVHAAEDAQGRVAPGVGGGEAPGHHHLLGAQPALLDEVRVRLGVARLGGHRDGAVDQREARGGEVAELAGGLDDDVDAGPSEVGRGHQAEVGDPPERVPHRLDAEQVEDLADGGALGADEVAGPEGEGDLLRPGVVPAAVLVEERLRQPAPHRPRLRRRRLLGVDGEEVAPGGDGVGIDDGVAPGRGLDVAAGEAPRHALELEVRAVAQALPVPVDAGDARLQRQHRPGELRVPGRARLQLDAGRVDGGVEARVERGVVEDLPQAVRGRRVGAPELVAKSRPVLPVEGHRRKRPLDVLAGGGRQLARRLVAPRPPEGVDLRRVEGERQPLRRQPPFLFLDAVDEPGILQQREGPLAERRVLHRLEQGEHVRVLGDLQRLGHRRDDRGDGLRALALHGIEKLRRPRELLLRLQPLDELDLPRMRHDARHEVLELARARCRHRRVRPAACARAHRDEAADDVVVRRPPRRLAPSVGVLKIGVRHEVGEDRPGVRRPRRAAHRRRARAGGSGARSRPRPPGPRPRPRP